MEQKEITPAILFRYVWQLVKPFRRPQLIIFGCILLVTIFDALSSYCFSKLFDIFQKHGIDRAYLDEAILFIAVALVFILIRITVLGFQNRTNVRKMDQRLANHLNKASIAKFFSFSNGQHINEHSGVKQTIINSGTTSIQNQATLLSTQLVPYLIKCMVGLVGIMIASATVSYFFILIGIVFLLLMYRLNKKLVPWIKKLRDTKQYNSRQISELYRYVTVIKNENQEMRSLEELSVIQDNHHSISMKTWIPTFSRLQVVRTVTVIMRYAALAYALYLVYGAQITIGELFLIITWSSMFIESLWYLADIHKQYMLDKINIEKYLELFTVTPDVAVPENPVVLEKIKGRIEFRNVSFWYPKRVKSYEDEEKSSPQDTPVLKDISLIIEPGQKIGIVGGSGSGKSTLANLIKRSFDPQKGQILIDDIDLRLLDKKYLDGVGIVEQQVSLFDRSLKDNILFGRKQRGEDDESLLKELAKLARIDHFFSRLEHGFGTMVGEKGVKLSGGEAQRVGIARALAKEPSVLIFDEATSSLDSLSEKIVQTAIDAACKGKTSIVIAHRLSTVKNCDMIYVFREGILLDKGTHKELMKSCEYYQELVKHQTMDNHALVA